jgi:hypothetical protein
MNTKATRTPMESTIESLADQVNQQMRPAGLIPRHWCDACAKQTWVVTLEEAVEIVGISPDCYNSKARKRVMMRNIHTVTTSTGTALICLKSLLLCIFSIRRH